MRLRWIARDPAFVTVLCRELGLLAQPGERSCFRLGSVQLEVVGGHTVGRDRLELDDRPARPVGIDLDRERPGAARLVALGWATVELDRAALAFPTLDIRPGPNEPALGARTARARLGAVELVVLEPAREGRLAASLARGGEGFVALYLAGATPPPGRRFAHGALGSGVLLEAEPRWGPFLLVLDARPA